MKNIYKLGSSPSIKSGKVATLVLLVGVFGVSLALPGVAVARSLEEDVQLYIGYFNGDIRLHSEPADTLSYMGLSDTRLFDIIEKRAVEDSRTSRNDRVERNRVARYIRGLGFSGQPKYLATIERFLGDPEYARFAKVALEDQPLYQKWNPIISNRATFDARYSDDANRVMNMLRADDLLLNRLGAKRVYFGIRDEAVTDILAKQLRANYSVDKQQYRDSLTWMVKALGYTRNEKYRPLIEEIAMSAPDKRVREHATKALGYFRKR